MKRLAVAVVLVSGVLTGCTVTPPAPGGPGLPPPFTPSPTTSVPTPPTTVPPTTVPPTTVPPTSATPVPTTVPTTVPPTTVEPREQELATYLTGYSWHDNTPPGSPVICCEVLHPVAGGTGTFEDPITVATVGGYNGIPMQWEPGTRFYLPSVQRYVIVEDSGAGESVPAGVDTHLDVWIDGRDGTKEETDRCMSDLTGTVTAIKDPAPGKPVIAGPIWQDGRCAITPATAPPPVGDQVEAAVRYGWGVPLPASDEFDYTGAPDGAKWHQAGECWVGHAGNGRRCASNSRVGDGYLRQTGEAGGDSGWLASKLDRQYGRWEARVRSQGVGSGNTYHPLLIIWPQSNRHPEDGEYDFWENRAPNGDCAGHFIHYPHPDGPVQQGGGWCEASANLNDWNTVAIEWTPQHVKGFINGNEVFTYSGGAGPAGRSAIQSMPAGHLTIQLDNFHGSGMQPATYDVDWVRMYPL